MDEQDVILLIKKFKHNVFVLERRSLVKPNNNGLTSVLIVAAEFSGDDAQERAERFVETEKALAGKPGLSTD